METSSWSKITVVTGLLHTGRESIDGRRMDQYIQWFTETLKIPAPMVVFVEPGLVDLVKEIRGETPTKIIPQTLGSSPFGWSYPKVQHILASEEWRRTQKNPGDLTNKLPGYSVVTNNKFAWLWNAIDENPFHTELFFWIDAGLSRFFQGIDISFTNPHPQLIEDVQKSNKIFTVLGGGKENYILNALNGIKLPTEDVIGANLGVIMTGFFGGHISIMKHASEYVMKNYIVEMLEKNRIDHDQSSIFLHFQEHPDKYIVVPPHPNFDCHNLLLFISGQHFPIGV